MKKFSIIISFIFTLLLFSCEFLISPMGEELVVDGAEEIIKIEKEIFSTSMEGEADVREIKD